MTNVRIAGGLLIDGGANAQLVDWLDIRVKKEWPRGAATVQGTSQRLRGPERPGDPSPQDLPGEVTLIYIEISDGEDKKKIQASLSPAKRVGTSSRYTLRITLAGDVDSIEGRVDLAAANPFDELGERVLQAVKEYTSASTQAQTTL